MKLPTDVDLAKLKLLYMQHVLNGLGWVKQLAYADCWERRKGFHVEASEPFRKAWKMCELPEPQVTVDPNDGSILISAATTFASNKLKPLTAEEQGFVAVLIRHYNFMRERVETAVEPAAHEERRLAALRWVIYQINPDTLKEMPIAERKISASDEEERLEQRNKERERKNGWSSEGVRIAKRLILETLDQEYRWFICAPKGQPIYTPGDLIEASPCSETEWQIALGHLLQEGSVKLCNGIVEKVEKEKQKEGKADGFQNSRKSA